MTLQPLIVFVVVLCCIAYVVWTLMPQIARRTVASGLLRLPMPDSMRAFLQKAAGASAGCHCSGCDQAQSRAGKIAGAGRGSSAGSQVLVFHPRRRR